MEPWVADVLTPRWTAVLVVDVQHDFCAPDGAFARNGMDVGAGRRILGPLARLLTAARASGVRVVYLRFVEDPAGHVVSAAYDRQRYRAGESLRYCVDEGGRAIVPEVAPLLGEPVVDKVRASGFFNTALDTILRCADVRTLAVTGMATESCVMATVIDATARDYYSVLVTDCLASFSPARHAAALEILRHKHPAVSAADIQALWEGEPSPRAAWGTPFTTFSPRRRDPMTEHATLDVVVAGAGMPGVVAALAAARNGARTLLTDRFAFLGGNVTAGLLGNFLTFHNMKGEQICDGIPQEIVDACIDLGGCFPDRRGHLLNPYGNAYTVTPVDGEPLKLVAQRLCVEAGVGLLLNAYTLGPVVEGNRVVGIRVADKSGQRVVRAKVVIDATGDADLVAGAGGAFLLGDDTGRVMSISLFFRLGGVDLARHLEYVKQHPDQFMLGEDPFVGKTRQQIAAGLHHWKDYPLITGYYDAVREAKARGEFHPNRERVVFSITTIPGVVTVNSTSILGCDPTSGDALTRAALEGREQIYAVRDFFRKYAPGFEQAFVLDSAAALGVRESRRIVGEETLTTAACLEGRKTERDIARGAYCLDVHEASGKIVHKHVAGGESYGVPYGTIVPRDVDGILVAGRSLASERFANGSVRVQAHVMAIGQAAGTAAAMCAAKNWQPREVPVAELRDRLRRQGAVV